jgi:hypothetical protein
MASNTALIATITDLCKKLDADVAELGDLKSMSNKKLSAIAKDLRAKVSDAETTTPADAIGNDNEGGEPAASEPEPEPEPEVKHDGPVVAEGKHLTVTGNRTLNPGDPISPKDLAGGKDAFNTLKEKGFIVG